MNFLPGGVIFRGNDGAGLGHAGAPEKQYKDIETGKKSIYFYPALCYYVKGEDWDFWGFLRNPTVFCGLEPHSTPNLFLIFYQAATGAWSENGMHCGVSRGETFRAPISKILSTEVTHNMARKVQFVETVLRDANQSLIATRLPYDKFEPMLETIDKAGYYASECWGGATFDVCLRYLHEDPWERLRKIRAKMPNTKLQMLLRGQNVLGYSHYPDDFVKLFVQKAVENGIDIIRIFDALNDVNNLKVAMEATIKAGAIASGTISYTTSPVHTRDNYVKMVKELKEMGASTICIKDMAGIMGPQEAYDLVSAIKDAVPELPIDLHTHSTTGLAFMTYLKAVEAGVDIIDTAISPFSGGTSQPATETLAYALRQLGYEVDLDDKLTKKMADYFKTVRDGFLADGTLMPKSMATDTQCLTYQIPGGMLSNLLSQLKQVNALDRFDEVLVETPKVREDMGYPPLVTPTSQMVGVQAVRNVLDGKRYKSVSKEIKAYCRGEYGRTPAPINPEIQAQILGDEKPLTVRYADTLEPVVEKTREKLGDLAKTDEDVLSYIAFPNLAEKFLEERKAKEENVAVYTITEC